MTHSKADVVVIGAGPGGLGLAVDLSESAPGLRVVLVEKIDIGGDSVSAGSIPSKALLHFAHKYHAGERSMTPSQILSATRAKIEDLRGEYDEIELQRRGIDVMKGEPFFAGKRKIIINDEQIKFKYAVIATGSRPKVLSVRGLDEAQVLTARDIYGLKKIPKRLLIVGAGRTGIETACAFACLGSKVTVVNENEKLFPNLNKEIRDRLDDSLKDLGIIVFHSARLQRVVDGQARVEHKGAMSKVSFDYVLFSVGRDPVVPDDLKKAHVKVLEYGIPTDLKHRTTNKHIFAIGDVASVSHFTHIASSQARSVVEYIIDRRSRFLHSPRPLIPALLFTDPQVATIGYSYKKATQAHRKRSIRKITVPYHTNHRAKIENTGDGILTVVVKRRSGKIVGAQIAGASAVELLTPFCIAMQEGLSLQQIGRTILPYPTYAELINKATDQFYKT